MRFFPLAVFTLLFFTSFSLGIRVDLEAPAGYVVGISSVQSSSTSLFTHNDHVVILHKPSANSTVCPAPLARLNDTSKEIIKVHGAQECNIDLVLRVYMLDVWSEAKRKPKDGRIVKRIRLNRVHFNAFKYLPDNDTRMTSVINLTFFHLSQYCSRDIILVIQHLPFDKRTQPYIFSWGEAFLFISIEFVIGMTAYSVWYFDRLGRRYGYYIDPYELELEQQQQLEENGAE